LTHALRVEADAESFHSLFVELARAGERAGWLALDAATPGDDASVAALGSLARGDGLWKTVAIEAHRTVAVKTRRGPQVLRDLLREHFRGCRVVLVRGSAPLPLLQPRGEDWELAGLDGAVRRLSSAQLVAALRSPHLPV
jgi:hypothetical protein